MVLRNCKSTAEYYQEYYLRHKDRYKYLYYSKKLEIEQKNIILKNLVENVHTTKIII